MTSYLIIGPFLGDAPETMNVNDVRVFGHFDLSTFANVREKLGGSVVSQEVKEYAKRSSCCHFFLRGEAKCDFSHLRTEFDAVFLFYLKAIWNANLKTREKNLISLGKFLINPKICSKDGVRRQIDLNLGTSKTNLSFWNMKRKSGFLGIFDVCFVFKTWL